MAENEKTVKYDIDGYDIVTAALRELVNQYPATPDEDEIAFSVLADDGGKAMFPISGAMVETETEDICGNVVQVCLYPFYVIYRAGNLSENRKAAVKEWLDNLGKWLEGQTITIGVTDYTLTEYPPLTGKRKFLSIERQTPAYLENTSSGGIEDWAIYISARYQNEFEKI